MPDAGVGSNQRVDQWLWHARITKSRTLAQNLVGRGKVRLNRAKIDKASTLVKAGDVLTVVLGPTVRSLEILAIGVRRGPATEAQLLYRDLTPAPLTAIGAKSAEGIERNSATAVRSEGSGRPTKRERRQIIKFKDRSSL
ncbi:MAG TPA: RNA-binding S4 domain-containing protein [Hyphomicrobium sp.]|jgi:ribosome-associated heat shock protein Hsp15